MNAISEMQSPPPFTKLLGIMHPDMVPDLDSLRVAIAAAVDCGLIGPDDCQLAQTALIDAARFSAQDPFEVGVREVHFIRRYVHALAVEMLSDTDASAFDAHEPPADFAASKFFSCLGRVPDEVKLRLKCAAARPALKTIVSASAADHLVSAVMDLAVRVPGARERKNGDVVWYFSANGDGEVTAATAWLKLPGPGVFSKQTIDMDGDVR